MLHHVFVILTCRKLLCDLRHMKNAQALHLTQLCMASVGTKATPLWSARPSVVHARALFDIQTRVLHIWVAEQHSIGRVGTIPPDRKTSQFCTSGSTFDLPWSHQRSMPGVQIHTWCNRSRNSFAMQLQTTRAQCSCRDRHRRKSRTETTRGVCEPAVSSAASVFCLLKSPWVLYRSEMSKTRYDK